MQNRLAQIEGCVFICGQRGMGKTSYLKEQVLPFQTRVIVYDHMAEFTGLRGYSYFHTWESLCDYVKRNQKGALRAVYMPLDTNVSEFELVCRIPFSSFGINLIVDEVDQFATPVSVPERFKRLLHFGRHFGSRFIGISRRPADVSRAFTSQCNIVVAFRQTEPRDIIYLKALCGDAADSIPELPKLHYLKFENGEVTRGKLSFAPAESESEKDGRQNGEVDTSGGDSQDSESVEQSGVCESDTD